MYVVNIIAENWLLIVFALVAIIFVTCSIIRFIHMPTAKQIENLMEWHPVKAGTLFHITPGTVHANGLSDVAARLEALGALAGLSDQALARQVSSALHWILHVERDAAGIRRLRSVGRPRIGSDGRLEIEEEPWPVKRSILLPLIAPPVSVAYQ